MNETLTFIEKQDWPDPIKQEARIVAKVRNLRTLQQWDKAKWGNWADNKINGLGGA